MREIKFRGKREDNGEWVFGLYVKSANDRAYIIIYATEDAVNTENEVDFLYTEVIPETVGQYTGLRDKNGVEIYEGDIVRIEHDITETQSLGSIENNDLSVWEEVIETFDVEDVVAFVNGSFDVQEWAVGIFMPYEIEVIGAIHDKEEEQQ